MITLEQVYPWLNKFGTSHISPSSEYLINQMRTSLDEDSADKAGGLVQQLKDLAFKLRDNEEVTEVLVECADGFYILNRVNEAETILLDAVSRAWSDLHRRAVIQWMLGYVQWQSFPSRQQAVISWQNSLSDFQLLSKQPGLSFEQHAWYKETRADLEQSLLEAMEQVGRYQDIDRGSSSGNPGEKPIAQTDRSSFTPRFPDPGRDQADEGPGVSAANVSSTSDILQLFTISDEIPAGDFGPSGIDPFPIGTVEIDRLLINGRPYSIHSTRGRRIINLPLDQKISVVKVKGDSMDQENITANDYVILRKVDAPSNGDIVMAEIVGIDSQATLKLFFQEKDRIKLKPHSSNPVHKHFEFGKENEGFIIRGVVVAVLKPAAIQP